MLNANPSTPRTYTFVPGLTWPTLRRIGPGDAPDPRYLVREATPPVGPFTDAKLFSHNKQSSQSVGPNRRGLTVNFNAGKNLKLQTLVKRAFLPDVNDGSLQRTEIWS